MRPSHPAVRQAWLICPAAQAGLSGGGAFGRQWPSPAGATRGGSWRRRGRTRSRCVQCV